MFFLNTSSLMGQRSKMSNHDVFLSLRILFFIQANSEDLDVGATLCSILSGSSLFAKYPILQM